MANSDQVMIHLEVCILGDVDNYLTKTDSS